VRSQPEHVLHCSRTLPSAFRTHVLNVRGAESAAALTPVRLLGSVSFLYLKHNDVYILFVTRQNANAMLAMAFMKQVCPLPAGS
jgi:AP-2 complex subunit mu-1